METCGAEVLANQLLSDLVGDKHFDVPVVDLTDPSFQVPVVTVPDPPARITNADLTTKIVDGTGTFDTVMGGIHAHLKAEFDKGRITGEQYSKAYVALSEAALQNSVQFLLGRDQSYWAAVTAQYQAEAAQIGVVEARVKLETAKAQLQALRYQALTAQVEFALGKLKLSTEDVQFCSAKYQLDNILPEQKLMIIAQRKAAEEGIEAARAQTLDTRTDGTPIVGMLGKQKALYSQQITSYQRDAENKVVKLWSDAWITMKTMDEGLLPPSQFTNANFDSVLSLLRERVDLGAASGTPGGTGSTTVVTPPTEIATTTSTPGDGGTTYTTTYGDGSVISRFEVDMGVIP